MITNTSGDNVSVHFLFMECCHAYLHFISIMIALMSSSETFDLKSFNKAFFSNTFPWLGY